jgi:anti-sigma regulatory factor (Ser/Thr protein kinase)
VEAVIRDDGVGATANPEYQGAGYGVVLMEALADRFDFDPAPGVGTTVRMQFTLPLSE